MKEHEVIEWIKSMPECRHSKDHHSLFDPWLHTRSDYSGLDVMLKPLVNLVVPESHHLHATATRFQIIDVNIDDPFPVFSLLVPGNSASND